MSGESVREIYTSVRHKAELNLFSNIHLKLPKGLKHQNHPGAKVDVLNAQSGIF